MAIKKCKTCKNKEIMNGIVGCLYTDADCRNGEMYEAVTNADRIRAMTDEELAAFMADKLLCPAPKECDCDCATCWLDWLKQPPKEN